MNQQELTDGDKFISNVAKITSTYDDIKKAIDGLKYDDVKNALNKKGLLKPENKILTDRMLKFKRRFNGIGESDIDKEELQNYLSESVTKFNGLKTELARDVKSLQFWNYFDPPGELTNHKWLIPEIIKESKEIIDDENKGGRKTRKQRKHRRKSNKKKSRKSRK